MNHHTALNAEYVRTLTELRGRTSTTLRPERRTARETMARHLHRLAERLDGN